MSAWLALGGLGAVVLAAPAPLLGGAREQACVCSSAQRLVKALLEWQLQVRLLL
jgi:hypothetical protein